MANEEQLKLLKAGVEGWNKWREATEVAIDINEVHLNGADLSGANLTDVNFSGVSLNGAKLNGAKLIRANLRGANLSFANLEGAKLSGVSLNGAKLNSVNLSGANLSGTNLEEANFNGAILNGADLSGANLKEVNLGSARLKEADLEAACLKKANLWRANLERAKLSRAELSEANLIGANLIGAKLNGAKLIGADLEGADLKEADLKGANLEGADLKGANLEEANLKGANLNNANLVGIIISNAIISRSNVYGASVWDLQGEFKEQYELIITPPNKPAITVDNIEIAQFIYLILNNKKIRDVINTLTSKTVLILGRFSIPERKAILDALRDKLREYDLLPIVFDFDRPVDQDFTETIKTLASISYFVIADVTNPKSSPLELQATVPDYQIPFVPIIQEGELPFAMMVDLQKKYNWVLDTISYDSLDTLIEILKPHIIDPAIKMRDKLRIIKAKEPTIISGRELKDKGKKSKQGKP